MDFSRISILSQLPKQDVHVFVTNNFGTWEYDW